MAHKTHNGLPIAVRVRNFVPHGITESHLPRRMGSAQVGEVEKAAGNRPTVKVDTRIGWVDAARALGILAVVYGHVPALGSGALRDFIYLWHMPLFFILSGFFQKPPPNDASFAHYVTTKIRRRIIPYFGYSLLALAVWYGISKPCGDKLNGIDFYENVLGVLRGEPYVNIPLWFYGCLFIAELAVYPLLRLSSKQGLVIGFVWMLAMANPWLSPASHPGVWKWGVAVMAVPFLIVGFHGRNYVTRLVEHRRLHLYLIPITIFVMMYFMHSVDMRSALYGNLLIFYLTGFAGSLWVLCLAAHLQKVQLLEAIGKASAFIFPLHFVLMPLITALLVLAFKMPPEMRYTSTVIGHAYLFLSLCTLTGLHSLASRWKRR